jgi:hypothetical protein
MKRLRHPIRAIREPFGTAGLIVACVALVAALGGTALAAKGALTSKQKKEVEKIAKKFAGTGPEGKQGVPGPAGKDGSNGADGANGTSGSDGKGAEAISFTGSKTVGSVTCTEGGVEVRSAGANNLVCNGKKGTNGQTGFTDTLPGGKTEVGAWSYGAGPSGLKRIPISFTIPLAAPLGENEVHFINEAGEEISSLGGSGVPPAFCDGDAATPTADPGHLCVYAGTESDLAAASNFIKLLTGGVGASTSGAVLLFGGLSEGGLGSGAWAVTAEE